MKEFTRADKKLFMMGFEKEDEMVAGNCKQLIYRKFNRTINTSTVLTFSIYTGIVGLDYRYETFGMRTNASAGLTKKEWKCVYKKVKELLKIKF